MLLNKDVDRTLSHSPLKLGQYSLQGTFARFIITHGPYTSVEQGIVNILLELVLSYSCVRYIFFYFPISNDK